MLMFAAGAAHSQDLSGPEIMKRVRAAYEKAVSLHMIVTREDVVIQNGNSNKLVTDCEFAARGRERYFARIKRNGTDAIAMCDGENTWKMLPSQKKWTQIAAAASGAAEDAGPGPQDLRTFVAITTFGQFAAIAASGQNPQVEKTEDLKVGGAKIPCYVVHTNTEKADYKMWIDRERFYVLDSIQTATPKAGLTTEIRTRTSMIEVNQEMPDNLFAFAPRKGWEEVEMLILPGEERASLLGSHAAGFALKSLEGEPVALNDVRGKPVVLDFWASWCGPCRAELPLIEKLRTEFNGKVAFYGVNDEETSTVKSFVKKNGYDLTTLLDSKRQVHRMYGVNAIPTLLVIDAQGVIRTQFVGGRSEQQLREAIQSALN
jgi:cytochrome c biogenesis protein CcmG, thiol:disulfide interchange protein DsbE